jgi:S1-C subfamily serine protease
MKMRYDEHGHQVEQAYFGLEGRPVRRRVEGYARVVHAWDPSGLRRTDVAYYDEAGRRLRVEVVIREVYAGQARRAGVRPGDVLLAYDGVAVPSALLFRVAVGKPRVVPLLVGRGKRTLEFGLGPGPLGIVMEDRVLSP